MYELVKIGSNSYYINCPAKMGLMLVRTMRFIWWTEEATRMREGKLDRSWKKNNWYLKAILNTHSNADHIGGNKYLQSQTG